MDRVPARPCTPGSVRRQAGYLRRAQGHQGLGVARVQRHLAAQPGALFPQRARRCGQERAPCEVSAFVATAYAQESPDAAKAQWRKVADQFRPNVPKIAKLMDTAEEDVLAYLSFPPQHRTKLHSTNPLERLNGEIKRRTDVVGIFPNEDAIIRLVGAILLEQNDEWAVQRARYITLESVARLSDVTLVMPPTLAA